MANNLYKIYVTSNDVWEEIELDDLNLSTVFSVEEISDISQRKDNITKTITLKGTKQNNKVLGALYSIDRDVATDAVNPTNLLYNYKPNKYIDCFVLENNVEIIRGKLLITSIDVNDGIIYYNASIVGTVYSFFSQLTDRRLEDLDSFDIAPYNNLVFNATNIKNSWNKNNFNLAFEDGNSKYPNLLRDSKMDRYEAYGSGGTWTGYDTDSTRVYRVTTFAVANQTFGIQTGSIDRTMPVTQGQQYTISFKMRGTIDSLNYGYLMRSSGGNSNLFNMDLPNLSPTTWNTYTKTITAPFTGNAWIMLSYRNSGDMSRWFEIKDIKFSEGAGFDTFTYNPNEFKYTPYVYPMIDYGGGGFTDAQRWNRNYGFWRWDVYRPAIYVRSYLDAIFRGFRLGNVTNDSSDVIGHKYTQLDGDWNPSTKRFTGTPLNNYRWVGNFKTDVDFNKLIIPYNEASLDKIIIDPSLGNGLVLDANLSGAFNRDNMDSVGYRPVVGYSQNIINPNYISSTTQTLNGASHRVLVINTPYNGTINIDGRLRITGTIPTIPNAVKVVIVKIPTATTATFTTSDIVAETTVKFSGGTIEVVNFNLSYKGDLSGRYAIATVGIDATIVFSNWEFVSPTKVTVKVAQETLNSPLLYGNNFSLYNLIPKNIDVKAFLKNIMLMFNLYLIADKDDDTLFHLYTYNEFYNKVLNLDKSVALDWSNKVDWKTYSINSNIDLPKSYEFRYKEDSDLLNQTYKKEFNEIYGEYKLLDSSGLIDSKKTEVMFSPTINLKWKQNIDLPVIYEGDKIGEGEREQFKSNIRILYFNGEVTMGAVDGSNNLLTYRLVDATGGVISDSNNIFSSYGHTSMVSRDTEGWGGVWNLIGNPRETLYFEVPRRFWNGDGGFFTTNLQADKERFFLFHKYHQKQIKELTDINLMTVSAEVYLNESDISRLDFRVPIYLQSPYGSAYFKLLRVEYNDANVSSAVTLQKVVLPDTNIR